MIELEGIIVLKKDAQVHEHECWCPLCMSYVKSIVNESLTTHLISERCAHWFPRYGKRVRTHVRMTSVKRIASRSLATYQSSARCVLPFRVKKNGHARAHVQMYPTFDFCKTHAWWISNRTSNFSAILWMNMRRYSHPTPWPEWPLLPGERLEGIQILDLTIGSHPSFYPAFPFKLL